jgi:hypothetical protein
MDLTLARELYRTEKSAVRSQSIQYALTVITAKVCFEGREEAVSLRVADRDGSLSIDLGDPAWQAVEVMSYG